MTPYDLLKAIGGAVVAVLLGTLAGWTSHSLTFDGQMEAIKGSIQRIEVRLDNMAKGQK